MKNFTITLMLGLTVAGGLAHADGGFLYGLNSPGSVSVNANKIKSLPGAYDPDTGESAQQAWLDLAIDNGNQYAIRGDGFVYLNGSKLWTLPYNSVLQWNWIQIKVLNNTTYALRQDGALAAEGSIADTLPRGAYYFTALALLNNNTYALRSDGNVYQNTSATPVFNFRAGNNDGTGNNRLWIALQAAPVGPYLYALRSDGNLYRGQINGNANGQLIAALPFPNVFYNFSDLYTDLSVNATGTWVVLRGDGKVYQAPDQVSPIADLPGNGTYPDEYFVDITLFNDLFYALRTDGNVYLQNLTGSFLKLPGKGYGRFELSLIEPNLSGSKDLPPYVTQYTLTGLTNSPVKIPVVATDLEILSTELTITPGTVPTGTVWDAGLRTFTWPGTNLPGKYTFAYSVSDNTNKPKSFTSSIKVVLPDADPAKNKPPYIPKIKGATPIVGYEYRVYIPLSDPDGDPVTCTVDTNSYPFSAGAAYDPNTQEFTWTPTNFDIGKQTATFTLSDGLASKNLKLKLDVKAPLFINPLP